jgi:PAS domain S-box-containing protein
MRGHDITLTGRERRFADSEIIVSKTDPRGRMTYVNDVFMKISDYAEDELIGEPHSMIRHPHMPRSVFKFLWDTIQAGREIFAYVNNRAKNGDNYWVLAHVTPTFDARSNAVVGYHSNRRAPTQAALDKIRPLYQKLYDEEQRHADRKGGLAASERMLMDAVKATGKSYDEFVLSL